jgi:hypothetical protein
MFLQPQERRTGKPARQNGNLVRSNGKNRDIIDGSDRGTQGSMTHLAIVILTFKC